MYFKCSLCSCSDAKFLFFNVHIIFNISTYNNYLGISKWSHVVNALSLTRTVSDSHINLYSFVAQTQTCVKEYIIIHRDIKSI